MLEPWTRLEDASDESRFGGKAVELGRAMRAGLPVPPGVAIAHADAARACAAEWAEARAALVANLGGMVAVRSSAVGEDGAGASFAGQHLTVLCVKSGDAVARAVNDVVLSGNTASALAYRAKLGLPAEPHMGVVVQTLVQAEVAGVMFTRNPLTGADERMIEATWGLGEAVVQGLVTPDRYTIDKTGNVLEAVMGDKDIALVWAAEGGTEEIAVDARRASSLCLDAARLASLHDLALRCEREWQGAHDIEFAFAGTSTYLLQRRAITRG